MTCLKTLGLGCKISFFFSVIFNVLNASDHTHETMSAVQIVKNDVSAEQSSVDLTPKPRKIHSIQEMVDIIKNPLPSQDKIDFIDYLIKASQCLTEAKKQNFMRTKLGNQNADVVAIFSTITRDNITALLARFKQQAHEQLENGNSSSAHAAALAPQEEKSLCAFLLMVRDIKQQDHSQKIVDQEKFDAEYAKMFRKAPLVTAMFDVYDSCSTNYGNHAYYIFPTIVVTVGVMICQLFIGIIPYAQFYFNHLEPFDDAYLHYNNTSHAEKIIPSDSFGNTYSFLMVNDTNVMPSIIALSRQIMHKEEASSQDIDDVMTKTDRFCQSNLFFSDMKKQQTIVSRICYDYDPQNYTIETHRAFERLSLENSMAFFQQNSSGFLGQLHNMVPFLNPQGAFTAPCAGTEIVMAKWPNYVMFQESLQMNANFGLMVTHPYHRIHTRTKAQQVENPYTAVPALSNPAMIQQREAMALSVDDAHLRQVEADVRNNPQLQSTLRVMVDQLNNHTCPSNDLDAEFARDVATLKLAIQYLSTDYVRVNLWYRNDGTMRHVVAETLANIPASHLNNTQKCNFHSTEDLGDVHARFNLDDGGYWHIATHHILPSQTREQTPSLEESPSKTKEQSQSPSGTGDQTKSSSQSDLTPSSTSCVFQPALSWNAQYPNDVNKTSYKWTELIANGTAGSPLPRAGHVTGRLGMDELFIGFGRSQQGVSLSDTYAYNINSNTWRVITSDLNSRFLPQFATNNNSVFVFSGYDAGSDHRLIRFNSTECQIFNTIGFPYANIGGGATVSFKNDFYVFGGYAGSYLNRTFKLNNFSMWNDVSPMLSPTARVNSKLEVVAENAYIFGGYNGVHLGDVWMLNLISSQWTQIYPTPDPVDGIPAARDGYLSGVIDDDILIFSGASLTQTNDLWKLNTKSLSWTLLIPANQEGSPLFRYHAGSFVRFSHDFYLWGGRSSANNNVFYNDLWRLRQTTIRLSNVQTNSAQIVAGQPFNLTWHVNTTNGTHHASVLFLGQNYTRTFNTPQGWMTLLLNDLLTRSFNISLIVTDAFDDGAWLNKTMTFGCE